MNHLAAPRRIVIERLEIHARDLGASAAAVEVFARTVAEGVAQSLALRPPATSAISRIETRLPPGASSAKAAVEAIGRRIQAAYAPAGKPRI